MHSIRNLNLSAFVPARLIEDQEKLLVWPHPLLLGESSQSERKGLCLYSLYSIKISIRLFGTRAKAFCMENWRKM
jgi:hypothetical protein